MKFTVEIRDYEQGGAFVLDHNRIEAAIATDLDRTGDDGTVIVTPVDDEA